MTTFNLFKTIILVQMFYAVCISLLTISLPSSAINYVVGFGTVAEQINLETVSADIQESINSQTRIPVIDLGSLVFYSGNILIDLLLNFTFAIPQMISLFLSSLLKLVNIQSDIWVLVQLFSSVAITAFYFIGIIQLLMNTRTGRFI